MAASAAGSATRATLKVFYFPVRGRGGAIRLTLAESGLPWANEFLRKPDFDKMRDEAPGGLAPYKQLPVLEDGDFTMSQGAAILQYVASQSTTTPSMLPAGAKNQARAMELALAADDFRAKWFEAGEEMYPAFVADHCDGRWLPAFERRLSDNGGGDGFFVGDGLTYADVTVFDVLHAVSKKIPTVLESYPKLKAFMERMAKRPAIATLLADETKEWWP